MVRWYATATRLVAAGLLVTVAAACGRSGPAAPAAHSVPAGAPAGAPRLDVAFLVQVDARVLVDGRGYPLYVFRPDAHRDVTCAGECAQVWPPVFAARRPAVTHGNGVRSDLVGSDPDPVAGRVVTYNRWPLYTYAGDPQPGFATGQGLDVDGGYWYLIRPDGDPIVASP